MKKALTDLSVRRLKPAEKNLDVTDMDQLDSRGVLRQGFFIRVSPKGRKNWYGRFPTPEGYWTRRIGSYPGMSLKVARERFDVMRYEEKRDDITVADLCKRYIQEYARHPEDGYKTWREVSRELYLDVIPNLGSILASEVTRKDVRSLALEVKERGSPATANWMVSIIRRVYNWGVDMELVEQNPAERFKWFKVKSNICEALDERQLKSFLQNLGDSNLPVYARDALLLQVQTCSRIGEALNCEWSDIDFEHGIWTIPEKKSKNGKAHRVSITR